MAEKIIQFEKHFKPQEIFGNLNGNATAIEHLLDVRINSLADGILLLGDENHITMAEAVILKLFELFESNETIGLQLVNYLCEMALEGNLHLVAGYSPDSICVTPRGRPIKSKTIGQNNYIKAIQGNEVVFSIGPAGTGKTFLGVAMAVNAFRNKSVSRIILTRPAVEAGEKLGFLPGDLQNKVDPYMKPLYDSLNELMGAETYLRNMDKGNIEVSPLAYMRGRTLDDAFIILDEAQNTTPEQMKMFLTRIGFNSKVVITGDITQIDLPHSQKSGLIDAIEVLEGVPSIGIIELTEKDVVRSAIVQRIIRAYGKMRKKVF